MDRNATSKDWRRTFRGTCPNMLANAIGTGGLRPSPTAGASLSAATRLVRPMAAVSEPARSVGLGRSLRTLLVAALVVVLAEALLAAWAAPQLGWSFPAFLSSLLLWTGFGYLLVTALAWTG